MKFFSSLFLSLILTLVATVSAGKDLPKIAVWDLTPGNINPSYAQDLTSILVSEISKLEKYEVYSQDNVRTLAGWTAERMQLGCTDTKCLTALGQMDISKLISGRVGKIGNRYSVSLNLFDTQNARSEIALSEFGRSEDELIDLVQVAVRKLLGVKVVPSGVVQEEREKTIASHKTEEIKKDQWVVGNPGALKVSEGFFEFVGLEIQKDNECIVTKVNPKKAAASVGIRRGDIIIEVNGMSRSTYNDFSKYPPLISTENEFKILRNGKELTFKLHP